MRLPRPDFTSALVALALGTTLVLGACAARSAHAESSVDRHARDEVLGYGFRALDGPEVIAEGEPVDRVSLYAAGKPFSLELPNGEVRGQPLGDRLGAHTAAIVQSELARYPATFLTAIHLHRVLLAQGLTESGRPIPSLPNCGGALLLDADAPEPFLRRLVHHEVFHFADLADDGTLKSDDAWEALNDHFFVYGDGGRTIRDPGASTLTDAYPGFLDLYARSAVEEDKAEVFAFLMTDPHEVRRIAAHDPIVAAKVRAVRERTSKLSPQVGAALGTL